MEWLVRLLDDVDDVVSTLLLLGEHIRKGFIGLLMSFVFVTAQAGVVILALVHPPLALATALLLFVTLLYRLATSSQQPLEIA